MEEVPEDVRKRLFDLEGAVQKLEDEFKMLSKEPMHGWATNETAGQTRQMVTELAKECQRDRQRSLLLTLAQFALIAVVSSTATVVVYHFWIAGSPS